MVDVLVFGPHPDDVEILAGGLILASRARGYTVGIIDVTRGEAGTRGTPAQREAEARLGAERLDVAFRENLGLPDGSVRPTLEARDLVIDAIRRHRPRLLVAPVPRGDHPDHAHTGALVKEARFLAGARRIGPAGEPWRPGRCLFYPSRQMEAPSLIVDISDVFDAKMHAIRAHASQFHVAGSDDYRTPISSPDFLTEVEATARHFGAMIGARFGEPYLLEGPIAADDPIPLVRGRGHGAVGRGEPSAPRDPADRERGAGTAR